MIEPYRSQLPVAEVRRLDALEAKLRAAQQKAKRAYKAGRHSSATRWDAKADDLAEQLEARIAALAEDLDPAQGLEPSQVRLDPEPGDYLAAHYAEFIAGRSPHFRTEAELAGHLRGFLSDYAGPGFRGATDEEILDAARDAYKAKRKRRDRQRKKKKAKTSSAATRRKILARFRRL